MAIRTTSQKVFDILDGVVPGKDIAPFIEAASSLVDGICDKPINNLSVSQLTIIETWLSAHFYCVFDARTIQEAIGGVMEMYESKVADGLRATRYGQAAIMLDYSGSLAAFTNTSKLIKLPSLPASGRVIGIGWVGSGGKCP